MIDAAAQCSEAANSPYPPALEALLKEACEPRLPAGRLTELRGAIRTLYARLPVALRAQYAAAVQEIWDRQERGTRGGPVFENVVQLFSGNSKPIWSAEEVCAAVDPGTDTRQVLNVLSYLVRAGRIQRVGRGRYYVPKYDAMIVTSDDLGGEPARYEGD